MTVTDDEIKHELENIEQMLTGISKELHTVSKAFPRTSLGEIDADGHRHYHEALIRSAQQQEKFWSDLRADLTKKGITAIVLVLIGLLITGLGVEFKAFLMKIGG